MEMNFQKIVLIIAICLLIVALVIISYMMRKNALSVKWPPTTAECPDYWNITGSSGANATTCGCTGINCVTSPNAAGYAGTINLTAPPFNNSCQLFNWTQTNKIAWDGVSNVPTPC